MQNALAGETVSPTQFFAGSQAREFFAVAEIKK